ncbi:AF4/FMR2 family member lilli-like isoform X2 [Anopheles aquasalis]|uniref:AF4/FMR2 family member lilli-like isoform X2 n=1 Tax=Anopheles aquasalis TaxID=42839 RepID=UPI00215A3259|nr:AF4/FMR2 family member lilli-like isoform X2 [Anopheles aquasalis]
MMADTPTNNTNGGTGSNATNSHANGMATGTGTGAIGATDPTVIPQWKKELIQRRKNLAKTIGVVHDSASTAISAASSPVLAHPRTPTGAFPVGSPFYAGAAATKATTPTSPNTGGGFIATVGVHSTTTFAGATHEPPSQQQTDHQHHHQSPFRAGNRSIATESVVVVANSGSSAAAATATVGIGLHGSVATQPSSQSLTTTATLPCGNGSQVAARRIFEDVVQVQCSGGVLDQQQQQQQHGGKTAVTGQQQQQQQQQEKTAAIVAARQEGVAARKMVAATATEEIIVYEKSVIGEERDGVIDGVVGLVGDAGEELTYGPGIVQRLRCRFLSLTLRQPVIKQRPSLKGMRRATSLNNLLDEESEDLSEREQSIGSESCGGGAGGGAGTGAPVSGGQQKKYQTQNYSYQHQQQQQQHYTNGNNHHNHLQHHHHQQQQQQQQPVGPTVVLQPQLPPAYQKKQQWIPQQQQAQTTPEEAVVSGKTAVATAPFLRGVQNSYTRTSRQVEKKNDYNRYTKHHRGGGGADSVLLKRARSVEALVRYDHKAWERDVTTPTGTTAITTTTSTTTGTVAPATGATVSTPTPASSSSPSDTDSNVIILDEIANPTSTTMLAASPTSVAAEQQQQQQQQQHNHHHHHHHHHHQGSNGISAPGTPAMNGVGRAGMAVVELLVSDCVTIEEKIINGREKGDPKPKRLTSIIDADERPPPDVVKQTMKIFEANASRRGGGAGGGGGRTPPQHASEVANKVANYRSIIISTASTVPSSPPPPPPPATEKPPITHPKPPLSPKKPPNIKPRTTGGSPKHQPQQVTATTVTAKPPPSPKSLEAVNNAKNAAASAAGAIHRNGTSNGNNNLNHHVAGAGLAADQQQQQSAAAASLTTPPSPPARTKHVKSGNNNNATGTVPPGVPAASDDGFISTHDEPERTRTAANVSSNGSSTPVAVATVVGLKNGGSGGSDHLTGGNYENGQNQDTHINGAVATTPFSASSPSPSPSGICDSPLLHPLTSKLPSLHLATSTPTGVAAATAAVEGAVTASTANGTTAPSTERRNLEYVTSDEENDDDDDDEERRTEYTLNPSESSEEESATRRHQDGVDVRDSVGHHHPERHRGNNNSENDDEEDDDDDEEDGVAGQANRKVSRTAMENIARAGTTTQFRFNGQTAVKSSYLPGMSSSVAAPSPAGSSSSGKAPAPPIPMSRESLSGGKGTAGNGSSAIISETTPIEVSGTGSATGSVSSSGGGSGGLSAVMAPKSDLVGGSSGSGNSGAGGVGSVVVGRAPEALTRREIEKNQINREKSGESTSVVNTTTNSSSSSSSSNSVVHNTSGSNSNGSSSNGGKMTVGAAIPAAAGVTLESKSKPETLKPVGGSATSGLGGGASDATSNSTNSTSSFVAKWGVAGATGGSPATVTTPAPIVARKKPKPPPSQHQEGSNTMVFNFSDRKDVPDYIENDGVIIRPRPRELPKPGESGFVVLGDLTLETSTDPDDAWAMGPPSPCNGEFANAYIVINGKSSMRNKTSRSNKFKIQFDDSLTSTYEYPSETSLLETNGFDDADSGPESAGAGTFTSDNGLLSHSNKLLSSVPLGSAPFASYTPVKAAIDTSFELGVTRTPSPSAASTASSTGSSSSNGSHTGSSSNSHSHSVTSSASTTGAADSAHQQPSLFQHIIAATNGNGFGPGHHPQKQLDRPNNNNNNNNGSSLHSNGHNGDSVGIGPLLLNGDMTLPDSTAGGGLLCGGTGEPESIQYLKPASDEQTVNWSQGTRVTDLLF